MIKKPCMLPFGSVHKTSTCRAWPVYARVNALCTLHAPSKDTLLFFQKSQACYLVILTYYGCKNYKCDYKYIYIYVQWSNVQSSRVDLPSSSSPPTAQSNTGIKQSAKRPRRAALLCAAGECGHTTAAAE